MRNEISPVQASHTTYNKRLLNRTYAFSRQRTKSEINSHRWPIYAAGVLDSIGFLQYFFDSDQIVFYVFLICLKIVLLTISKFNFRALVPSVPLIASILFGLLASSLSNSVDLIDVMRVVLASSSILITIVVIDGDFRRYSMGLAANGFLISVLYLQQYISGSIIDISGRSYFFNGSHPNLGGEILSVIVILSTVSLRPMAFSALLSISAYSCWLMQSRTSLLAMILSAILYYFIYTYKRFGRNTATALICSSSLFVISYLLISYNSGSEVVSRFFDFFYDSVFLVEDTYRGSESGFSGRDLHWHQTFQIIDENFFFGAGIEYPRRLDILQPHSWFLYPIALFGVFGFFVIASMIHAISKVLYSSKAEIARILPILILLALNDRFMSMNVNPLAVYVYLFALMYKPNTWTAERHLVINRRVTRRQPDIAAKILARQRSAKRSVLGRND